MKILIVASFNKGRFAPFIVEQAAALEKSGCVVEWYGVTGKGVKGYLKALPELKKKMKTFEPDIIHAHFGLSGLLANLQRRVPVITTYHGSDINVPRVLRLSKMAMRLSAWNVFVSQKTLDIAQPKRKFSLLPCGIDLDDSQLVERQEARRRRGLPADKKCVLFAGAFDNAVKNASLAKEVAKTMNAELIELKGYSREEVTMLMCAVDAFLMTSLTEGSPQVIKEAMACGCPIVSVDVGDVRQRTDGVEGCFVAVTREPEELANLLQEAFRFGTKTKGREKIVADGLDNRIVAEQLMTIYRQVRRKVIVL